MGGKNSNSGLAMLQYVQAQQQMEAMKETMAAQQEALSAQSTAAQSELDTLKSTISNLTTATEAAPPDNAAVAASGDTASASSTDTARYLTGESSSGKSTALLGRLSQVLTGTSGTSDQGALATTAASTNKKQLLGS